MMSPETSKRSSPRALSFDEALRKYMTEEEWNFWFSNSSSSPESKPSELESGLNPSRAASTK